ncbi:MAG: ribose-5-phosphate isomerase RpiA [Candidatus Thermoplasmatota archaeon]|jgi:ribose 5-phosphate isomerase A|nr:ribose-5-phosphate isomerase RpiA [Candidatus Thermoplasmatota archaeon]
MDKKEQVAREALNYILKGDVVGLGSGTTASQFIKLLGQSDIKDSIVGVATSTASEKLAREVGIKTVDIDAVDWISLTVDGADEVDKNLNILKGGGGQLTREKKVRNKSKNYLVIVSDDKLVERIGNRFPIPVEVLPFGHETTKKELEGLGLTCQFRGDFVTDNGNLICDCKPLTRLDLNKTDQQLKIITGVVETGLFLGGKKTVLVSDGNEVKVLK